MFLNVDSDYQKFGTGYQMFKQEVSIVYSLGLVEEGERRQGDIIPSIITNL